MNDLDELAELQAQFLRTYQYQRDLARHPDCRDPDHPGCERCMNEPNEEPTMNYEELQAKVVEWAEARRIIQNSNNLAQAVKTLEEVTELFDAIVKGDREAQKDAYGDILVTLIVGCATSNLDLVECLAGAYDQIKDRKGYLTAQGVFVKQP